MNSQNLRSYDSRMVSNVEEGLRETFFFKKKNICLLRQDLANNICFKGLDWKKY